MRNEGSTVAGIAQYADRPLPRPAPGPRPASFVHQQRTTSTGLDFDALAPTCTACGTRSPLVSCASGLCPVCDTTSAATPAATPAAPQVEPPRRAPAKRPAEPSRPPGRPPAPPRVYDEALVAQVIELYVESRLSTDEIAPRVGETRVHVRRILAGAGIELRKPGGGRQISDDEAKKIVQAYHDGDTMPRIAKAIGRAEATIRRALVNAGVQLRDDRFVGRRGHLSTDERAKIVAAYQAGNTIPQIANDSGRGKFTVRNALIAAGVTLRDDRATHSGGRRKVYDPADVERCTRLYDTGLSLEEVGKKVGCGSKAVATMLTRAGVTIRPGAHQGNRRATADTLAPLRTRLAELGATAADVKRWALDHGHLTSTAPGLPPRRVIEAYAAAAAEDGDR